MNGEEMVSVPSELLERYAALLAERDSLSKELTEARRLFVRDTDELVAELAALKRDATRWRKARAILTVDAIESAEEEYLNFGSTPCEHESLRADSAIDATFQGK